MWQQSSSLCQYLLIRVRVSRGLHKPLLCRVLAALLASCLLTVGADSVVAQLGEPGSADSRRETGRKIHVGLLAVGLFPCSRKDSVKMTVSIL